MVLPRHCYRYGVHPDEACNAPPNDTRQEPQPMQWSNKPRMADFRPSGVNTWLPVNPNYKDGINVKDQQHQPELAG